MRLSKQTEYGLRAVIQMAGLAPRQFVQCHDLAQREKLPEKFLESILATLRRAGLLESKVGRDGGYRLAHPPRELRVGQIIHTLEGRMARRPVQNNEQSFIGEIAVRALNERLSEAASQVLDKMNLEQLVEQTIRTAGQQQQMYYI